MTQGTLEQRHATSTSRRDVLFLSTSDMIWGAERSMLAIARLVGTSPDFRVALATCNEELRGEWGSLGSSAVLPRAASPARRVLVGLVGLARCAPRGGTVIVFDLLTLPGVALLRPWLTRRRVRIVLDLHDSTETRPRLRSVIWLTRAVDQVVCVSEYVAQQLPAGVRREVVHRPIDPMRASRTSGLRPVVAIIGVVLPHKQPLFGLRAAAAAAQNSDFDLLIVGAAPRQQKAFEDEVDALGRSLLGDRYRREAARPHEQVLDGVDVLLFLNPTEPSGRIIAEAQSAGVAVICTDRGGAAEFVIDGTTGYSFTSGDLRSAAAAIERAVGHPEERRRLGESGRRWSEEHYSPDGQALRYAKTITPS